MNEATIQPMIEVNGERQALEVSTLAALIEARGIEPGGRGIAVALNGSVVPRAVWTETILRAGDTIEVVQAKQGG